VTASGQVAPTKIWVQSCSADDGAWDVYQKALQAHAAHLLRGDTAIEFHGLAKTIPGIDSLESAQHLATLDVVRATLDAQDRGFDAFLMVSTIDAGRREVRELLDMPSVFITECAVRFISQFGRFGFLTHNPAILNEMERMATDDYGLGRYLVRGACLNLTYRDFAAMYDGPARFVEEFALEARKVIERGAAGIVPAGGPINMFFVDQGIQEVDGVPVLDTFGLALKTAEMLGGFRRIGLARDHRVSTRAQRDALGRQYRSMLDIARDTAIAPANPTDSIGQTRAATRSGRRNR
jgi:Asp/Glu/hydantoin racemase